MRLVIMVLGCALVLIGVGAIASAAPPHHPGSIPLQRPGYGNDCSLCHNFTATPTQAPTGVPATGTPTRTPTGVPPTPTRTATGVPATSTPTRTPTGLPGTPTRTPTHTPTRLPPGPRDKMVYLPLIFRR
jgi:hypothetical protein